MSNQVKVYLLVLSLFLLCTNIVYSHNRRYSPGITQVTFGEKNHFLGIFDAWSPDDNWIVFSCGPNHTNDIIQKVNAKTGKIVTLYKIKNQTDFGPGCGTPSYCKTNNKVVFIHGPRQCGPEQKYEFWRRSGVAIEEPDYKRPIFLDARDVTYPFTPGALRGGTHCHEWSYDGQWIAFTYNDMIMAKLQKITGKTHDLRTIGISHNLKGVAVDKDSQGENIDGRWFTVLLVEVKANPKPGSDEICRAYENCWVGDKGYKNKEGLWQRAIAFKGKVVTKEGDITSELYVVDIPIKIDISCKGKPLEGTKNKMPYPPAGTTCRRLTNTDHRKYPGLSDEPRFWLRSSPKGDKVFFLIKDSKGINQVFYISPLSGKMHQVTFNSYDAVSTPSINPDGNKICYVCDGSVYITDIKNKNTERVTQKSVPPPSNPIWSNNGEKIVFNKPVSQNGKIKTQIFIINNL